MTKQKKIALTPGLIFLLTLITGVVVSNLYYIQPIAEVVSKTFGVSPATIGIVATLTQLGYAIGLLFIVPFGDIMSRYRLIIRMLILSTIALTITYFATNFLVFAIAGLLIGLTSIVPQIIIPFAAGLSQPSKRGQVLGTILGGLLLGVLLSRSFSGILTQYLPWRNVYLIAIFMMLCLTIIAAYKLPKDAKPTQPISYWQTISSLPQLFKSQVVLREAAISGFFMFGSLSMFWSVLAFYIASPTYHAGSGLVGALAVLGAAGALSAPVIGRFADRKTPRQIVAFGLGLMFLSYLLFYFLGNNIWFLMLGIILLDVGNQCGQVANQTRVQNLGATASSRNNTIFMFAYFIGGASGSFVGTLAWGLGRWSLVCLMGITLLMCALLIHYFVYRKKAN